MSRSSEHVIYGYCLSNLIHPFISPYAAGGNFGQYKMMQNTFKNDWNPGYSFESTQQELFNEYQHDMV